MHKMSFKFIQNAIKFSKDNFFRFRNHIFPANRNTNYQRIRTVAFRITGNRKSKFYFVPQTLALSFGFSKAMDEKKEDVNPLAWVARDADQLYEEGKTNELYDLLVKYKDSENADILWRLCRAAVDKGKRIGKEPDKKELYFEAYEHIQKALKIDPDNFAVQKWAGIMLSYTGEYEGTKKKIADSYVIKEHFQKALELNPKDATSIHLMGKWCFAFADMPWLQKKMAAALFAKPPDSNYDEALFYFLKAEESEPGFFSANLLMIGKCYLRMGKKPEAKDYLQKAVAANVKTSDDQETHKEADKLLKSL